MLENLEIPEIWENRQTVENKGESVHFLEIPPAKRPPFVMTPFSGPDSILVLCWGGAASGPFFGEQLIST